MELERKLILVAVLMWTTYILGVQSSHFRGGTISWKSLGGTKVHFYFRLGWTYNSGSGCLPHLIGQHVSRLSDHWTCQSGNCGTVNLHDVNYICTGANQAENWEQGENAFTYTFPSTGPFVVGYANNDWIVLSNGKGGGKWNIATTVDLRTRSDIGTPNSSPQSTSKPMYYVQLECEIRIKLPVVDPDDDVVRCRWSRGNECQSVCGALPYAYLDEETCTLVFNTTLANKYVANGVYAVAVTMEDFPRIPMTLGGSTKKTPNDALSAVSLQFLVTTIPQNEPCDVGPRFVPPTPEEKDVIIVEEGDTVKVELYADNGNDTSAKANQITVAGPVGMTLTPVTPAVNLTNTFTRTFTWQTTPNDLGNHIVCGSVRNDKGKSGEQRCFNVKVVPKGCGSSPCQNSGKCVGNKGNYTCVCRPGYTGYDCEVDIDDCVSNPCPLNTYCLDGINSYTCPNITTTTASPTTTWKNHTGMCPLEYEHCRCAFRSAKSVRNWLGLSTQGRDAFAFSFGVPIGLVLSAVLFFSMIKPCERRCARRHSGQGKLRRTRKKSETIGK